MAFPAFNSLWQQAYAQLGKFELSLATLLNNLLTLVLLGDTMAVFNTATHAL